MSEHKIDTWISRLERLVILFKPKFYNTITRIVVISGLTLSIETQINILEALAVAGFEHVFGPSDFLRGLFASNTNPWVGVVLVSIALFYHAVVTVGLNIIKSYKASIPKEPILVLGILNADNQEINDTYNMRGTLCSHEIDEIPNYTGPDQSVLEKQLRTHFGAGMVDPHRSRPNPDLYRQRARLLKVWGGAEIISLTIDNAGSVLANNVRVEIRVKKIDGLSASNQNKKEIEPKHPSTHKVSDIYNLIQPSSNKPHYDIKHLNNSDEYIFNWDVGSLQTKEKINSFTKIFMRTERNIEIEARIFCDEFSEPVERQINLYPPEDKLVFELDLIKLEKEEFNAVANPLIIDGYMDRRDDKEYKNYMAENKELLP